MGKLKSYKQESRVKIGNGAQRRSLRESTSKQESEDAEPLQGLVKAPDTFKKMPEECLHWIRIIGDEAARSEAIWKFEEENKKTVLATLKLQAKCKSDAASETWARDSDYWKEYLYRYQDAFMVFRFYHHELKLLYTKMDAWRTKEASNRK